MHSISVFYLEKYFRWCLQHLKYKAEIFISAEAVFVG